MSLLDAINPSEDAIVKEALLKEFRHSFPHLAIDRIPIEYDTEGKISNRSLATELNSFQREFFYDVNPLETGMVIANLPNRSGKSWLLAATLTLLLIDDHPTLRFDGVKGDFWLLTNSSLLKTEYPKMFMKDPAFIGREEEFREEERDPVTGKVIYQGFKTLMDSKGVGHKIKKVINSENQLEGFVNLSTGKAIRFWSFGVNEQKLAGSSPLSVFCDEMGDKVTTSKASGANKFTLDKLGEILVRVGSDSRLEGKALIVLFFTLTLGEVWLENLLQLAKDGGGRCKFIGVDGQDHQVRLVPKTPFTSFDNPYYNKTAGSFAYGLFKLLGHENIMSQRLLDPSQEDSELVFPSARRPLALAPDEIIDYPKKYKSGAIGWKFIEAIDPGKADATACLMSLCHPVEGIIVTQEVYERRKTVPMLAQMIKAKETNFFGKEPDERYFDKHYINKTSLENPTANIVYWNQCGLRGKNAVAKDRSYDKMFELIALGLIKYDPKACPGLHNELRKHKYVNGVPDHISHCDAVDALRYIANWYHDQYYNKIHVLQEKVLTEKERLYQEKYQEYLMAMEQHKKDTLASSKGGATVMGRKIYGLKTYKR